MKAQTQWTIICFLYWIYLRHIYISAMLYSTLQYYRSQCFRDLIICVLTFGIHRVSLCKNRHPYKDNFHFLCILHFYSLPKTLTRCIQNSRLYHSPCTHAKQAGTALCESLVFCYFQVFVWCILFADLLIYRSLNFASDFLFLTHLAGLCISQFLYAGMFMMI